MTITLNGTTGITSDTGYTGDGVTFVDGTPSNTLVTNTSGNVGIGTSSPVTKLDVTGQGRATTGWAVSVDGSTFTPSTLNAIPNYGTGYITSTSYTTLAGFGGVSLYTNQLERMRVDQSGNVGIGTGSPGGKFAVVTGSSAAGTINNWTNYSVFGPNAGSNTGAAVGISYNTTDGQSEIASLQPGVAWKPLVILSGGLKILSSNGGEAMRITTNGGVSFGSSGTAYGSSGQVLQSNGDATPTWVTPTVSGTAKAWVNFNGSGGGIRASSNVSSVSVNGTGRYTVNMTSAQTDANYARVITASGLSGDGNGICSNTDVVSGNSVTASTSSFGIMLTISGQSGYRDSPYVSAAVFR